MSLMIIAMTGILLGFLCVMVGFFMEAPAKGHGMGAVKVKKIRQPKKRIVGQKKAA